MNEGLISTELGLPGIPSAAEDVMVARNLSLSELTGARLHLAHISTAGSVSPPHTCCDSWSRVMIDSARRTKNSSSRYSVADSVSGCPQSVQALTVMGGVAIGVPPAVEDE